MEPLFFRSHSSNVVAYELYSNIILFEFAAHGLNKEIIFLWVLRSLYTLSIFSSIPSSLKLSLRQES